MIDAPAGDLVLCACGLPLHYADPGLRERVERMVATHGPMMIVTTSIGSWWVPRHYVALHGLRAADLPELAARYHWEEVRHKGSVT